MNNMAYEFAIQVASNARNPKVVESLLKRRKYASAKLIIETLKNGLKTMKVIFPDGSQAGPYLKQI